MSTFVFNAKRIEQLKRANPLRLDPTRTSSLRKSFMADLSRRFDVLSKELQGFMVEKDALDLGVHDSQIIIHASPREFRFNTNPQKLVAFNEWFAKKVEEGLFSVPVGTPFDRPWMAEYVDSAFKRGQVNAFLAAKHLELAGVPNLGTMTVEQFLASSLGTAISMDRVKLLATRVLEDLRGVTSEMATKMTRILTQGLIDGVGPLAIAKDMQEQLDISLRRAFTVARTEIIRAHAEGQLTAFKELGIGSLQIRAEWLTAGDDHVCPQCQPNEGKIFTLEEASGLIPLHPNCRCAWAPYV